MVGTLSTHIADESSHRWGQEESCGDGVAFAEAAIDDKDDENGRKY